MSYGVLQLWVVVCVAERVTLYQVCVAVVGCSVVCVAIVGG